MSPAELADNTSRISTGVRGLNYILCGGLIPNRSYLVRGGPGSGKTTLGWHFLANGLENQEKCLYITMGESQSQIVKNASVIGIDLQNVEFLELVPSSALFTNARHYELFTQGEAEREPIVQKITEQVKALKPQRIFLDAITHLRYITPNREDFRQQVHAFLRFLLENGNTVLFSSEASDNEADFDLQFMSDGVICLEGSPVNRLISVSKFRGSDFHGGEHSYRLGKAGITVFPRLLPDTYARDFEFEIFSSGVPEIDELLHGGIERGSISIFTGPTGVGKTTLGLQFMKEAAGRGERSVIYSFEENVRTLISRSKAVNIPIEAMINRGTLSLVPIEPLYYSADEFADLVRQEVELNKPSLIMLDSISGYKLSVRNTDLIANVHALSKFLQNMGVAVLLINEVETITGDFKVSELGASYIADNIVFLRYLEIKGELRRAIGVLKKRSSNFEKNLREIEITRYGIKVGRPLTELRGILRGTPEWS